MKTKLYMPVYSVDILSDILGVESKYCYGSRAAAVAAMRRHEGIKTEDDEKIVGGFVRSIWLCYDKVK